MTTDVRRMGWFLFKRVGLPLMVWLVVMILLFVWTNNALAESRSPARWSLVVLVDSGSGYSSVVWPERWPTEEHCQMAGRRMLMTEFLDEKAKARKLVGRYGCLQVSP